MTGKTEPLGDARGDHRRPIADRDDAVDRRRPGGVDDRLDRRVFVVKPDRNRPVAPGIVEHVAAIGGKDQLDAEALGGLAERARLISGRRREQQARVASDAAGSLSTEHRTVVRIRLGAAVPGLAQIRHAPGDCAAGAVECDAGTRRTPARSCASALISSNTARRSRDDAARRRARRPRAAARPRADRRCTHRIRQRRRIERRR